MSDEQPEPHYSSPTGGGVLAVRGALALAVIAAVVVAIVWYNNR